MEDRTVPSGGLGGPQAIMHPTYHLLHPGFVARPLANGFTPPGLNPTQIRHAYGIDQITFGSNIPGDGLGQTIAIVDAYDDPNAAADLTAFDQQFQLSDPTFIKVGIDALGNASTTNFPSPDQGWSTEIALDVEWAHAIAPKATILLVEAYSPTFNDLLNAVDYARNYSGVAAVSMSWGASEFYGEASYDSHFTTPAGHSGVTFFASSGDYGAPTLWPSISDHVVSTGGTSLTVDGAGNYGGESGWSGSGGGPSALISKSSYQANLAIYGASANGMRAAPDVAYDSDPNTGPAIYASYAYGGWVQIGGTSAASPQWAALMSIVDEGRTLGNTSALDGYTQTLPNLYQLPSADFHDITTGNNGYPAGPGFDFVTGLGTPVADKLVADLAGTSVSQVLTSITLSPTSATIGNGAQQQFTATALDQNNHNMIPQPAFTWSVSGLGSIDANGLYTAPASGTNTDTVQVSATVNGVSVSNTATVSYLPGPSITSLTASPSPATGTTTSLSASVSDPNGGPLSYTWSVLSKPTGATTPTFSPASGSSGTGTISSTATFFQTGNYRFQISVTDGLGVNATASVDVTVNATFSAIAVSPASASLLNGGQKQFSATAQDQFGNALAGQPTFSWTVSGLGAIDGNGLYTAPLTGTGTDTVNAAATVSGVTLSGTASVAYLFGVVITSISANPNPVTGTTTTLSVVVANPFATSPGYYWSLSAGPASVTFSAPYSSTTTATFSRAGAYTFQVMVYSQASNQTLTATVNVTVNSTLGSIMMMPTAATVPDGGQQQFNAYALDQFHQMLSTSFSWSVVSGPGSVNSSGLYKAPASGPGPAVVQASATVNGVTLSASATVTLVQPPAITSISASPNPVNGTNTTLEVTASNPGGGNLYYGWSMIGGPAGVNFSSMNASTTTAYFSHAGTYTFQVMVTNQSNLMASATVTVTVNSVFTSVSAPSMVGISHGSQMQLTAFAYDQFRMPMSQQPVFVWSLLSGPGTVTPGGLYRAPTFGSGIAVLRVQATINGVTLGATVTVRIF